MDGDVVCSRLAEKIIRLRIATRLPCMCEESKGLLTLRTKILFLLSNAEKLTPQDIMSKLKVLKPNMAALAKGLERDGYILRIRDCIDRRSVAYSITDTGREFLNERIQSLARACAGIFDNEQDYETIIERIEEIAGFMAFLSC